MTAITQNTVTAIATNRSTDMINSTRRLIGYVPLLGPLALLWEEYQLTQGYTIFRGTSGTSRDDFRFFVTTLNDFKQISMIRNVLSAVSLLIVDIALGTFSAFSIVFAGCFLGLAWMQHNDIMVHNKVIQKLDNTETFLDSIAFVSWL